MNCNGQQDKTVFQAARLRLPGRVAGARRAVVEVLRPPPDRQHGVHPPGAGKARNGQHVGHRRALHQREPRRNLCSLVASKTKSGALYVSAYSQGMAVDFDVKGMKAVEVRKWH